MLFSSIIFIGCFLPAVLFIYYVLLRKRRLLQNYFLLLTSLMFYAWGEPRFVFILISSFTINWLFGIWVDKYKNQKAKAKLIIVLMLIFNLSILFVVKYLMFTITNINALFGNSLTVPLIVLPIGISFYTFHAISYVIDVFRGRKAAQKNLLNLGLYISFFPQLIAGPIVRYDTIASQIMGRKESFDIFSAGVCRFIVGLAKKVLLANSFAAVVNMSFSIVQSGKLSVTFAWLGARAYALQIYFDFSGYSDMAVGLGMMFGFKLPENFNYPYIAKSASEFWRRWHISLGMWFRDYVYFPLGGSRVSTRVRLAFNLFVVWFLTGVWHGANWTFMCWGLLYFVFITIEKITGFEKLAIPNVIKHLYTLLLILIGWVLFRSNTIADAIQYLRVMFGFSSAMLVDAKTIVYCKENLVYFGFGLLFSAPVAQAILRKAASLPSGKTAVSLLYTAVLTGMFILALAYLVKGTYNPFIYFNF
ncbi:MAG: MBOAT family protein [Firmicutes bacterium]|nr:MBOAT family protein [Bacillota bacterium]